MVGSPENPADENSGLVTGILGMFFFKHATVVLYTSLFGRDFLFKIINHLVHL